MRSWRASLPPPAPSAERIAISRRRVAERASWTLATLAVAVASRSATATRKMMIGSRTSRVIASRTGTAVTSTGPRLPKTAMAVSPGSGAPRPRAVPSAAACAGVTPGLSRAMALNSEM